MNYAPYKESVIHKQITKQRYSYLQEKMYKFIGFDVQERTARRYEYNGAAHVLGYVREADQKYIEANPPGVRAPRGAGMRCLFPRHGWLR